jgi:hypothetical protein
VRIRQHFTPEQVSELCLLLSEQTL